MNIPYTLIERLHPCVILTLISPHIQLCVITCYPVPRKKIQTTSSYIYDTLFMKGVNADVSIAALGETSLLL
jgi:hypothetical protein